MANSPCSYFNTDICRSCELIDQDLTKQISNKEILLKNALAFLGSLNLENTTQSKTLAFRNKAKWIVTGTLSEPIIGLTGKTELDEGRELLDCPIIHPRITELSKSLPKLINEFSLTPYRIKERKGELKALIVFYSPYSKQMYLRFVLRSTECILRIKKLIPRLQSEFPDLACISANIQAIPQAVLEGPEEIYLTPQEYILHTLPSANGDIPFKLSPQAFVQTNTECSIELYKKAAEWIAEIKPLKFLELYCGQGAFSFFAASSTQNSLGIEINEEAIKMAEETAATLKLSHLKFLASDALRIKKEIEKFSPDLILVNPPRRGLGKSTEDILSAKARHFIYSSCSYESLSYDLRAFHEYYNVRKIQIFDMFPHTKHFETLVWLEQKN